MKTDICLCSATREDHDIAAEAMKTVLENKTGKPVIIPTTCDRFRLDRKATWAAEKANGVPRRTCLLMTGCVTCGTKGAVTYHKDARGVLRHTGCPGPRPAEVAR